MCVTSSSRHFDLYQLAKGVFAAIATPDGAAFSNAGIIDLGGECLIFDTFDNPMAAEDLKRTAEQVTGKTPRRVVISHYHPDHWSGNQVFAGSAEIISTCAARETMITVAEQFHTSNQVLEELKQRLSQSEAQLAQEENEYRRQALQNSIIRQRYNLETLPTLRFFTPTLSFEGRLNLHGSQRRVEVRAAGSGHTPGDCILLLPDDHIAFVGDLAFFQTAPYMGDCLPEEWLARIDELAALDAPVIVPGHGGLGGLPELHLEQRYIQTLVDLVKGVRQAGGSQQDAFRALLEPPYDTWQAVNTARHHTNIRRLFQLSGGVG